MVIPNQITSSNPIHCPECDAKAVTKYGTYKGVNNHLL